MPEIEIAAAKARWRDELPRALPELAGAADALLARISPPHWALEWSLPLWLSKGLGLPHDPAFELVVGNVYGLAYIRLRDDLVDDDMSPGERTEAHLLATVLHQRWLAVYIQLFGRDPVFWHHFERYLGQWQRATLASAQQLSTSLHAFTEADFLTLGHRGAPLKVCAAGVSLLTERQDVLPQLETLLDALLIGAVLLDHAIDWAADLAAGRPNAFIAHASPWPQTPKFQEANRLAVLNDLVVGTAARPYFALIRTRLLAAARDAEALGFSDLTDYVTWLRGQADSYGRWLTRTARTHRQAAAAALLHQSGLHEPEPEFLAAVADL